MSLQKGDEILGGKYKIIDLVGEGAFSRVWLAEEPEFGHRRVAIKELKRDQLTDEELKEQEERFRREVDLAAQLDTAKVPNVVKAITLEKIGEDRVLVMEYAEGGSLADLITANPKGIPIDRAIAITLEVCSALDAFHNLPARPVHRDIKPRNILLAENGHARLTDFGLAQLPAASIGRSRGEGRPQPGTPLYMAPEQEATTGVLHPSADVYALGCVLFEMLTGTPYKRTKPGTAPSALRKGVPRWLDYSVLKAVAEDRWDRFQSAQEMANALKSREQALAEPPPSPERELSASARGFSPTRLSRDVPVRFRGWWLQGRRWLPALGIVLVAVILLATTIAFTAVPPVVSTVATWAAQSARQRATVAAAGETRTAAEATAQRATVAAAGETRTAAEATAQAATADKTRTAAEATARAATATARPAAIWERIQDLPLVERLWIPSDGTQIKAQSQLQVGAKYTIAVFGQFTCAWSGQLCDAEHSDSIHIRIHGTRIAPEILADPERHRYAYPWTGGYEPPGFEIVDVSNRGDNSGGLIVEIREGRP